MTSWRSAWSMASVELDVETTADAFKGLRTEQEAGMVGRVKELVDQG